MAGFPGGWWCSVVILCGGWYMAMLGLACHTAGAHAGAVGAMVGHLWVYKVGHLGGGWYTAGAQHQVGLLAVSMVWGWL